MTTTSVTTVLTYHYNYYNHYHHSTTTTHHNITHLDVDNGAELAEVLIELGDVVELWRDLANLQLGVNVVEPLWKASFNLAEEG